MFLTLLVRPSYMVQIASDHLQTRGGSTFGQGKHVPPDSLVAPRFKS